MTDTDETLRFISTLHPYNTLPHDELGRVAGFFARQSVTAGTPVYHAGQPLDGLYLVDSGTVEITDTEGEIVSQLSRGNSFGERGLLRDGLAATNARVIDDGTLLMLPKGALTQLIRQSPAFARFFDRGRRSDLAPSAVAAARVADFLTREPLFCSPETPIIEAARMMRDAHVSSIGVVRDDRLVGIVTVRDMSNRVVAEGRDGGDPVSLVMTGDPHTLDPDALGADVLSAMVERRIGHLPVVARGRFAGMVTQTDLMRVQAVSASVLVHDIMAADTADQIAGVTARIPDLLASLVGAHLRHEVVTRMVTDVADAATRRLIHLAEAELGPAPTAWCWAACGSQGRQEQTGISDQDNCLIMSDEAAADDPWFAELARRVTAGLDRSGYMFCPGDMMASNARWRQPLRTWRRYFRGWIDTPDPQAQMLASVMFDLRTIAGDGALLDTLKDETLEHAARDQIFVAHMISNSLKHRPPLGLIGGLATIRSGEHRHQLDMKMNGVVPVVDLGRIYALRGRIGAVNTRSRLLAAQRDGVVSTSGGDDLIAAYDLIQTERLDHQARQVRRGHKPDNFLSPSDLPDFRRSHLRDAFVVVRTMQSAASGRGVLA
jgi:CBS domain-containing protein